MARHALPLCLLTLLVTSASVSARSPPQKPGQCPPIAYKGCLMKHPLNRCGDNDNNCPGDQKCCPETCGKSCQKPFGSRPLNREDKPGKCPKVLGSCSSPLPFVDSCASDDSCPGEKKCCNNLFSAGSCFKTCTDPAKKHKEGECPVARGQCLIANPPDQCESDDSNCPGNEKCCTGKCGKKCAKPVKKQKKGECPKAWAQCARLNPPDRCGSDDYNCPGDDKCCDGFCGKVCTKPVKMPAKRQKSGECPAVRVHCLRFNPPDRCESDDSNCPGDEKCCDGGCGKECTKPVKKPAKGQKSGECPRSLGQCRVASPPDRCKSDDSKCPWDLKCCAGFCGTLCRKPVTEGRMPGWTTFSF